MVVKFTGLTAQHLNLQEDGIKLRAVAFKNKSKYSRKDKYRKEWLKSTGHTEL